MKINRQPLLLSDGKFLLWNRNNFNSDGKVTPQTFIFECTFEIMAAMPALPSHLGSFFWLVNFWRFLRCEGPSSGAAKPGMLCFNPAGWLADRRVRCAERVCTTASMDSQTLPGFFCYKAACPKSLFLIDLVFARLVLPCSYRMSLADCMIINTHA